MKKDTLYRVTEWDWLKLQLNVHSLQRKGRSSSTMFAFDDNQGHIICMLWAHGDKERFENISRDKLIESLMTEVQYERTFTEDLLQKLPVLRNEFDTKRNMTFQYLRDYGMGSSLVCEIKGDSINWTDENKI